MSRITFLSALLAAVGLILPAAAFAESEHSHDHAAMAGGAPGDPAQAKRTIEIVATDNVFDLKSLRVNAGETVRFVIRNKGQLLHEFTLGTADMHRMHEQEMDKLMQQGAITTTAIDTKKMPHAGHAHGNSVLIEPGKSAVLIWRFDHADAIEFACNIPGHYQSGMHGAIKVQ